eukprot:TRINITY_DN1579_c2_g1_i1.p1 TRINITY_DN1579_c2_g1~~TRINITY_DN1579_c2_g1_i1.p1  ORF type:complete len:671 (-),score=173.99 TRINITY_DN1579_c2_g1_i1:26-2038(-)
MASALTSEEFVRLQEELLFLKMQNHELRDENARSQRLLEAGSSTLASGAAKAGAGAVSALGAHAAVLKSTFTNIVDSAAETGASSSNRSENDASRTDPELENLQKEVAALRERFRSATEELASTRSVAMTAQREAAAAAAPTEQVPTPSAEDLREKISSLEAVAQDESRLPFLTDEVLNCLSRASLELALQKAEAVQKAKVAAAAASEEAQGDGITVLLTKVQKQQKELERLREAVDRQQSQIARLADKASSEKTPAVTASLPALEEQLRSTEAKLGNLGERLQSAEGASSQTFELQCHLQSLLDRVRKRDAAIEHLMGKQERLGVFRSFQRERLAMAEEDVAAHVQESQERRSAETRPDDSKAEAVVSDVKLETKREIGPEVGVQANFFSESPNHGADADSEVGACQDSCVEISKLSEEVDSLRDEKKTLKLQATQEVQELRKRIREHQNRRENLQRRASVAAGIEHNNNNSNSNSNNSNSNNSSSNNINSNSDTVEGGSSSSSAAPAPKSNDSTQEGEDEDQSSSLLYIQKIDELEQQIVGLNADLELLNASKHCLLADCKEKDDLIAQLLRSVRVDDGTESEGPPEVKFKKAGAGKKLIGLLRSQFDGRGSREKREEQERIAEEAMLDNLRLRKDLRTLAEEFRRCSIEKEQKTMAAESEKRIEPGD